MEHAGFAGQLDSILINECLFFCLSNKGTFCNNSEIDTLISNGLSVENKVKLSQPTKVDFVRIAKLHTSSKAIICGEQSETL